MTTPEKRQEFNLQPPTRFQRLRSSLALPLYLTLTDLTMDIEGEDNIPLDGDTPSILTVEHASDHNIPLAYMEAAQRGDTYVTGEATHQKLDPHLRNVAGFGAYMLVRDRFMPVSTIYTPAGKVPSFDPNDSTPMLAALEHGKNVMIATHSPGTLRPGQAIRPGKLAGLLALRSEAPTIPIAMSYGRGTVHKEHVTMKVGEPYHIDPYDDINEFLIAYDKQVKTDDVNTAELSLIKQGMKRIVTAGEEIFHRADDLLKS